MRKVIRDDMGYAIGYTDTKEKRGTYTEFCDAAGYTHCGTVKETLQSLDRGEREYVIELGELA